MSEKPKSRWHGMTWYIYYSFIEWQLQVRNKNGPDVQAIHPSLNISIVTSCCMVIEGFLFTFIKDQIFFSQPREVTDAGLGGVYERQIEDY